MITKPGWTLSRRNNCQPCNKTVANGTLHKLGLRRSDKQGGRHFIPCKSSDQAPVIANQFVAKPANRLPVKTPINSAFKDQIIMYSLVRRHAPTRWLILQYRKQLSSITRPDRPTDALVTNSKQTYYLTSSSFDCGSNRGVVSGDQPPVHRTAHQFVALESQVLLDYLLDGPTDALVTKQLDKYRPTTRPSTMTQTMLVITTGWENRAGWRVYPGAGRVRVAEWAPHQKTGPAGAGLPKMERTGCYHLALPRSRSKFALYRWLFRRLRAVASL
ncbi:hypothetical protein BKA70DRAFT_1230539 [Coprinopsis sp. MPI-PUGE-AT-0042]|nr:hypothetical protein BKA70DRAFT_1230539 [Coprinopsis sp. MPI-PUGE-AT-0042]